ncbi:hypothetical protein KHQ81_12885 [Mycoplasmatota bacterium]|nr:hypothetical protein KHQ81_12885 [Mycoplasmatota bacterium]
MIDAQGISTGEEVRRILEQMESGLIVNYKNFFDAKKDKPINKVDVDKWQRQQLSKFTTFQRRNQAIVKSYIKPLNKAILDDLKASYEFGINYVTKQIKRAKKKGKVLKRTGYSVSSFGKNSRVQKQIKDIQSKLNYAFHNALKDLDRQYLETVSKTKTLAKASDTLHSAIDLAGKTLLVGGITAGLTAAGRRMNIVNQLELQTVEGSQEIMFMGEGEKASEVGNYLVYITIHGSACPLCTPWQNKVLIDDVYQNGKPDGKHDLLSTAIKAGLFH